MANTSDSAQKLRDKADEFRRQAAALEARAAALTEISGPNGVAGALEALDKHAVRLRGCTRGDATPAAMIEMISALADLRTAAKQLDRTAAGVERKLRKLEGKAPAAKGGGSSQKGKPRGEVPPAPDDLSALDDPRTAAEVYAAIRGSAESTAKVAATSMRQYAEACEERGIGFYELDPTTVLPASGVKATASIFRWVEAHRPGPPKQDGENIAESGEAPADNSAAPDDAPDANGEHEAMMHRAASNTSLPPYTRIAISAGIAGIPPMECVNLRHDQASSENGVTTFTLADGRGFAVSREMYHAMCEWSGRAEGPVMVDPDGNAIADRVIAQSIAEAMSAGASQPAAAA